MKTMIHVLLGTVLFGGCILYLYLKRTRFNGVNDSIQDTSRIESTLKHIYEAKCGNLSDLERDLGKSTVRQLEAMGFIMSVPCLHGDTWKISERASRLGDVSFRPYSRKERFKDYYRYKLPRMLFGVGV